MEVEIPADAPSLDESALAELEELREKVSRLERARRRAERELEFVKQEMRDLEESVTSIVVMLDRERRIIRWNPAAVSTFGRSPGQVLGRRIDELLLVAEESRLRSALQCSLEAGEAFRLEEIAFRRPDGSEGRLGMTINPLRRGGESLGGFFILARDITEKVAEFDHTLEQERRAACVRLASEIAAQVQDAAGSIRRAMSEAGRAGAAMSEAVSQLDTVAAATRDLAREVSGSSWAATGVRGGDPAGEGSGERN